jgi:hypothetical protein
VPEENFWGRLTVSADWITRVAIAEETHVSTGLILAAISVGGCVLAVALGTWVPSVSEAVALLS